MMPSRRYLAQPWALTEVGLFRVSGNKRKILEYIEKFDNASKKRRPRATLADCFEPATICGLLKMVLQRERLPLSPWEGQNITSLVLDTIATDELKVCQVFIVWFSGGLCGGGTWGRRVAEHCVVILC